MVILFVPKTTIMDFESAFYILLKLQSYNAYSFIKHIILLYLINYFISNIIHIVDIVFSFFLLRHFFGRPFFFL